MPKRKQGSHSSWKTWKNDNSFSSPGKVLEFYNLLKILENGSEPGKMNCLGKNSFKLIVATFDFCCIELYPVGALDKSFFGL